MDSEWEADAIAGLFLFPVKPMPHKRLRLRMLGLCMYDYGLIEYKERELKWTTACWSELTP